jgi:prepilin-type processing-associated H-X9-DG protein
MTRHFRHRGGSTVIELLVVIAIIGILTSVTLPAVLWTRSAAAKIVCASNLRQIGLALHQYHDVSSAFPRGCVGQNSRDVSPTIGWEVFLLPYVEQESLWARSQEAFRQEREAYRNPPHVALDAVIRTYICPADDRVQYPAVMQPDNIRYAFTSYLGVEGTDFLKRDGVLFVDSRVGLTDVTDGTSNTLLAGERPPSADLLWGWWYSSWGQRATGSGDMTLGVRERYLGSFGLRCSSGPYEYRAGGLDQQCDLFHFWSLHPGGAHFLFCDGSVRFLAYSANAIMPALATRAGGEGVTVPD